MTSIEWCTLSLGPNRKPMFNQLIKQKHKNIKEKNISNKECGWPGVFIYVFLLMRIIPKEGVNNRVSTCFSPFKTQPTIP